MEHWNIEEDSSLSKVVEYIFLDIEWIVSQDKMKIPVPRRQNRIPVEMSLLVMVNLSSCQLTKVL